MATEGGGKMKSKRQASDSRPYSRRQVGFLFDLKPLFICNILDDCSSSLVARVKDKLVFRYVQHFKR